MFARLRRPPCYAKLAAAAYHLTQLNRGDWSPFGSDRLAAWLEVHVNTVDNGIKRLVKDGDLKVRLDPRTGKTAWCYKAGRSREVRYVGPEPLAAPRD